MMSELKDMPVVTPEQINRFRDAALKLQEENVRLSNLVGEHMAENYALAKEKESMKDQIQLMYKYVDHLEDAEKELMCMLNKYHDDDCNVCDRAYKAQDIAQFQRGVFHGCAASAMEKDNWITQDARFNS